LNSELLRIFHKAMQILVFAFHIHFQSIGKDLKFDIRSAPDNITDSTAAYTNGQYRFSYDPDAWNETAMWRYFISGMAFLSYICYFMSIAVLNFSSEKSLFMRFTFSFIHKNPLNNHSEILVKAFRRGRAS
jgi:hypothetical protein